MTNQEIIKNLAKIYLAVDKARSDLEDLSSDCHMVKLKEGEEDLYDLISDLASGAENLADEISAMDEDAIL